MYQEAIGNTAQDAPSSRTEARVEEKGGRFWVATGSFLEQWNMVMKKKHVHCGVVHQEKGHDVLYLKQVCKEL